jgi:hypothetical protein
VIHTVVDYLADEFLQSLSSGMSAELESCERSAGQIDLIARWRAELPYSPGLEVLARIGDSIAAAHNAAVREDERRLGEKFFNAVLADYERARPALLAVDNNASYAGSAP